MDRRRFVKSASLGTVGLLVGSVASKGQDNGTTLESPVISQTAWGRVWIHWTEPLLPSRPLLAHGLALPWGASQTLMESALKQNYRIYSIVTLAQASAAANGSRAMGMSGMILEAGDSEHEKAEKIAADLRLAHPGLSVLSPDPNAKQPKIMGSTVISQHGVLQVSSPTQQPWIDSNVAMVRFDRSFRPRQNPLIDFQWDLSDALQQQLGPSTENYSLAVAEAGALHSDLILDLHPSLEKGLVNGSDQAWAVWERIAKYVEFYFKQDERPVALQASVGIVTDNYDSSYETTNLMARHNIPFRVLPPGDLTSRELQSLDLIVIFSQPSEASIRHMSTFVNGGGVAILVSVRSPFPGQSSAVRRVSGDSTVYTLGRGKVIEIAGGVADPGTFSMDVRRLLGNQKLPVALWNAATIIAIPYKLPGTSTATVELVNYSADPMPVQVRVQGYYSSVRYETPEHGCCQDLTPTHQDGFTQFDVPWLRIGGRVHLGTMPSLQRTKS